MCIYTYVQNTILRTLSTVVWSFFWIVLISSTDILNILLWSFCASRICNLCWFFFFLNSILQLQIKLFNLFSSTIFLSFTSFFISLNLIKSKINVRFDFFISFQFSSKKIVLIFQKFSDLFECFWMFLWSKWTLFFEKQCILCTNSFEYETQLNKVEHEN